VKFHSNIEIIAFSGEEQGEVGSKAYASEQREGNANITMMIQADMLGYHVAGEPFQIGFPDCIHSPEVTHLVGNISNLYVPEIHVGRNPYCGGSDHKAFIENGFPATQVFERAGPIADPMNHDSGDVSRREGFSFDQIRAIAMVELAAVLHTAGFEIAE